MTTTRKRPNVKAAAVADEKPDETFWLAIGQAQARGIDVNFHSPTSARERQQTGWIIHTYNNATREHGKAFHDNTNADRKRALREALKQVWGK